MHDGHKRKQSLVKTESANRRSLKVILQYWEAAVNRTDFSLGNLTASLDWWHSPGIRIVYTRMSNKHKEMCSNVEMSLSLPCRYMGDIWGTDNRRGMKHFSFYPACSFHPNGLCFPFDWFCFTVYAVVMSSIQCVLYKHVPDVMLPSILCCKHFGRCLIS